MEINLNYKIGKTTNPKFTLAKEISDYFNGGVSPHFILGFIGKFGEVAVRQDFEKSKTGKRPISLFICLLKQNRVIHIDNPE